MQSEVSLLIKSQTFCTCGKTLVICIETCDPDMTFELTYYTSSIGCETCY